MNQFYCASNKRITKNNQISNKYFSCISLINVSICIDGFLKSSILIDMTFYWELFENNLIFENNHIFSYYDNIILNYNKPKIKIG